MSTSALRSFVEGGKVYDADAADPACQQLIHRYTPAALFAHGDDDFLDTMPAAPRHAGSGRNTGTRHHHLVVGELRVEPNNVV